MKKFISLLIGCSLVLAGAALAQPPEDQQSPTQSDTQAPEKTHKGKGQGKRERNAAKGETGPRGATGPQGETGAMQGQSSANTEQGAGKRGGKGRKGRAAAAEASTDANVSGEATTTTEQGPGKRGGKGRKGRLKSESPASATTDVSAETDTNVSGQAGAGAIREGKKGGKGRNARGAKADKIATPETSATSTTSTSASTDAAVATSGGAGRKVDRQKVKEVKQKMHEIKQQHVNFKAQPRPDKVPSVTFNVNYRIQGSHQWQGPQYEVYRSYHPERHDHSWYHSRYNRVELIGGGYYYFNNGYWFPAWGYDTSNQYYAYDAPIYVGRAALPPDRVIADVQAALQEMGYYRGEVDGLLGPLTREALTGYQADQGLTITQVIDEPTLDSLGMG